MKNRRIIILVITLIISELVFSQNKVDTAIVIIDSLYFRASVICEDVIEKTRCTDTIYSVVTSENIKNGFLSYIDHDVKNRIGEKIEFDKFKEKRNYYDKTYNCREYYKGFEFLLQTYIYIKLMYLNSKCDSVPVMEGLFYQNQKYDFYYCGIFKDYDINGLIKKEGNYYCTKKGERSISFPQKGVVQYGTVPFKYRKEEYGGAYIRAKKDGVWKYYKNGRLLKIIKYKKGELIKK